MNFMRSTNQWFLISAILIVPGVIGLATWGLKIGIDFAGGSLLEVRVGETDQTNPAQIREAVKATGIEIATVQSTGEKSVLLRTKPLTDEDHQKLLLSLKEKAGAQEEIRFETVGPTVSQDLTKKAISAVILAAGAIIVYIAWAFRSLPKPASSWRFGVAAVLALLHDLLFVIGAFAILGQLAGYEVDALFITALLTVMGFSVHDTIVVFDRIRENLRRYGSLTLSEIADLSITETLGRSLGTSLTVIFVLLALFLLGGSTTKPFVLALLLGITIGTYSSIFNATPILVVWQKAIDRRAARA